MCDIDHTGSSPDRHTFRVTFRNLLFDKSVRLVCCTVASMICTVLNHVNGSDLNIRSIRPVPYTTVYEVVLSVDGHMFPNSMCIEDIPTEGPVGNRPQLFISEEGPVCVTGIQAQMMDLLMRCCLTQKDLAHRLDIPVSTVSFNMRRLIDRGLVACDRDGYRIIAVPSVKWCEPQRRYRTITDMYLHRCLSEPDSIHRHLLSFIILNGIRIGMDIRPVMYNTGDALAHGLLSHLPDSDLDDIMEVISSDPNWLQEGRIRLIGKDPLTFHLRVGYDLDELMSEYINVFHQHFLRVIVQHLYGREYDVLQSDFFGVGNRMHIIMFGRTDDR